MEELEKAYKDAEILDELGLPISNELSSIIWQAERALILNDVFPLIMKDVEPLVRNMKNKFQLELSYSREKGLDIRFIKFIKCY